MYLGRIGDAENVLWTGYWIGFPGCIEGHEIEVQFGVEDVQDV